MALRIRVGLLATAAFLLFGCSDTEKPIPETPKTYPSLTPEQLDGILSPDIPPPDWDLPRPLWATLQTREEGRRVVVHIRVPDADPTLDESAAYRARCAYVGGRVSDVLDEAQLLEIYLVFDETVEGC